MRYDSMAQQFCTTIIAYFMCGAVRSFALHLQCASFIKWMNEWMNDWVDRWIIYQITCVCHDDRMCNNSQRQKTMRFQFLPGSFFFNFLLLKKHTWNCYWVQNLKLKQKQKKLQLNKNVENSIEIAFQLSKFYFNMEPEWVIRFTFRCPFLNPDFGQKFQICFTTRIMQFSFNFWRNNSDRKFSQKFQSDATDSTDI